MREAQNEYDWDLNFGEIAQIWRGGCIIRAAFLQKITEAYEKTPSLPNLLTDPYFKDCIEKYHNNWRKSSLFSHKFGIPIPTFFLQHYRILTDINATITKIYFKHREITLEYILTRE